MKYWELFFLTVGAGSIVGAVINPASWFGLIIGAASTFLGWHFHKKGCGL
jgi:hypothetical protein